MYRNGFCHKFIVACHILSYIECTKHPVLKAVNFFKPSSSILACNYTQKRVVRDAGYGLEFLVTNPVQTRESSGLGTKIDNEWLKWMIKMKFWTTSSLLSANLREILWESSFGAKFIWPANWFSFFWSFLIQILPRFSRCKSFSPLVIANQQTHQCWIHVEAKLIVKAHQRCFNVDNWLKMKVEPTYIYRCLNVGKTTLQQHW